MHSPDAVLCTHVLRKENNPALGRAYAFPIDRYGAEQFVSICLVISCNHNNRRRETPEHPIDPERSAMDVACKNDQVGFGLWGAKVEIEGVSVLLPRLVVSKFRVKLKM